MDIEEAREFFSHDRFATENGITLEERDENHAVASLALAERHRNAHGGVMGGAIFTLADFAFAALTNGPGRSTVAQQVSVSFPSARRTASPRSPRARLARATGAPLPLFAPVAFRDGVRAFAAPSHGRLYVPSPDDFRLFFTDYAGL